MIRYLYILCLGFLFISCSTSRIQTTNGTLTRQEYIDKYKDLAIKEMKRSGVPASITLAQGILESNNGNSRLARKGNNHFGIKCHTWQGRKIYHDDDARNECFRRYKSAFQSYEDHSDFLRTAARYDFLFDLELTDYKSWALGLNKAGYATNPQYGPILIKLIEENQLFLYDGKIRKKDIKTLSNTNEQSESGQSQLTTPGNNGNLDDVDNFIIQIEERKKYQRNGIDYIIVKPGDNIQDLSEALEMMPWELYRYNDLPREVKISADQELYTQPKRNKANKGSENHIVNEGETMHAISQMYGIKLKKLYQMNLMNDGEEPSPGQKLWLRAMKK